MIQLRLPRWLKIIATIYFVYLALVLLIATPLLNIFAPKIYREQTGLELKLEKTIWLNPFTLCVTVRQTSSALNTQNQGADHTPFWSFDVLKANVSLASIWRGHLVLDALELRGFDVQIDQTAPGRFNFSDILDYRAKHFPTPPSTTQDTKPAAPLIVEIAQFHFTAKHVRYRAPYAAEPVNAEIGDLDFSLTNFSTALEKSEKNSTPATSVLTATIPALRSHTIALTLKTIELNFLREQYPFATTWHDLKISVPALTTTANSDYDISVRDSSGGSMQINGSAAIAQSNATGQVQLHGINVLPAWQYLANKLAFDMKGAQLDGDIHYAVNWASTLHYQLANSQLTLRDAQLQARNDSDSRLELATLQLSNIQVDSAQPRAQIGKVMLDKLSMAGWNQDTHVSLVDMFAFAGDENKPDTPPWQIQLDDIAVQNSEIHWRASQLSQLPLTFAPLDIHASNLHWPDTAPLSTGHEALTVDANTALNNTAKIALNGSIIPSTQSGELHIDLRDLPLAWGDVFVRRQMRATLASGTLNARATIKLDNAQPISVQSDGEIDEFELHVLSANAVSSAVPTQHSPTQQPGTQATLTDKGKIATWKKLEWQQLALDPAQQHITVKHIVMTQPWAQFRINADGTNNFQQLLVQSSAAPTTDKNSASTKKFAKTEKQKVTSIEKPWQLAIDNIHIDRANIDFRDTSLSSAFRTNITELSGDIDDLNSAPKSKAAKVGLHGTVDGYAPVALTGMVDPFAAKPALNVALDITNLDLATLTPYSGTYAGYQIDGGRLSVQLVYTLENNRIKGTNHIIVNQMQLGKQVSGPKVMDLPLRLAIYLLTDSNGVMDLGVDVAGNVDDPDFSVSNIIWKALRNLIVKTVTSPFRALANLVGAEGRDDLDRVEFRPGSDQIVAGETEKLRTVNTALQKKSALKLNITGHVSPYQDIEALRDTLLSQQLIVQGGISQTDIQQQSKNWQREVAKLFKKRFPDEKANQLQVMQMNDAMRDNVELEPNALQDLAAHRALAVKQLLVADMGLAADRAFVKPADLGADKTPGLQATLQVE